MYMYMEDEKRASSRFMLASLIMLSIVRWFVRAKRLLSVDMCRKAVRQWHNRYCIRARRSDGGEESEPCSKWPLSSTVPATTF